MLGKDLQPGMLLRNMLIITVDHEGDDHIFDKPNISYVDLNDPGMGICYVAVDPNKEFGKIRHEEDSDEYVREIQHILAELTQAMKDLADQFRTVFDFLPKD